MLVLEKSKPKSAKKINLIFSCHNHERKRPAFGERRGAGGGDSDSSGTDKAFDAETSVSSTIRDGKPSGYVQVHCRDWVKLPSFMSFVILFGRSFETRCITKAIRQS